MKFAILALAFMALGGELLAQAWPELVLQDGRVLKDVKFVKQSPDAVVLRHSEGLAQVKKAALPAELQKQYPIDRQAAKVQERQQAAAKEELIRQKEMADIRARNEYEAKRSVELAFRKEEAVEAAKVEATRQEARARGELKGDLLIQKGRTRPRSLVLNVNNIGGNSAIFDWREIEVITPKGDALQITSAMPVDSGRRPDFTIDANQTRSFELVIGTLDPSGANVFERVRWKQ